MDLVSTAVLALSLSVDSFAAALGKGAALHRPRLAEVLRTGLIFTAVQTAMPLIGWGIGLAASSYVASFSHWIAFAILAVVGLHMIREGLSREEGRAKPDRHGLLVLLSTAIATSLDALAVGVSLAFVDANIAVTVGAIGAVTFFAVVLGMSLGRAAGTALGHWAEIAGGAAVILVGVKLLAERLIG